MVPVLAHAVVALALAAAPVQIAASEVPVQRPRATAPAEAARDYAGVDSFGEVQAPASPPAQTVPAQTVPTPVESTAPAPMPTVVPVVVAPEPAVEGPEEEDLGPAYDPLVDSPEAIRARHWLHGGIVFSVVGAVLTVGGIAMRAAPINEVGSADQPCNPRGDPAGNGCTEGGRNRSAAALAIPGAFLLAGGIAMITVGKLQQRRVRASLQADKRGFMLGATLRF